MIFKEMNFIKNIVFIGIMGSGKTFFSNALSNITKQECFDTDKLIEEKTNLSISEIFKIFGEEYFRNLETDIIESLSKKNNIIISTGGGVVLKEKNINLLKKNGKIIFIDREINNILKNIDVSKRPLLKDGKEKLWKLYHERIHLYKKYADFIVKNNNDFNMVLEDILNIVNLK